MESCITRQQVGLLLTLAGTAALAFSVQTKRIYEDEMGKVVDKAKKSNPKLFEPTETYIVRWLFRGGLALVALGTLLQW